MKKTIKVNAGNLLLIMVLILGLMLVGCGQEPAPTEAPAEAPPEAPAETPAEDKYPEKPITFIIPWSAGGSTDIMTRALAPFLEEELGTTILVENKEGAGSQVGLTHALENCDKEGYTVTQINQPHASFTIAVQGASYELSDFVFLNTHQIDPIAVNVLNEKPWQDMADLIEYIKEHPGEVSMGTSQMSGAEVAMLYLQQELDLDFIVVPYDGGSEARAALLGGHIDVFFGNAMSNTALAEQTRCLMVADAERSTLWPDAPTARELFPDNTDLQDSLEALASYRTYAFPAEFKENYPERFDKFLAAYEKAFHSEGHMAEAENVGETEVMCWIGPEETEKYVEIGNALVEEFAHYYAK